MSVCGGVCGWIDGGNVGGVRALARVCVYGLYMTRDGISLTSVGQE